MALTLKAARANKNLTQEEAAKLIGVNDGTLRNWEKGKSFPDVIAIKKIEEVYGIPYDQLIFLPK